MERLSRLLGKTIFVDTNAFIYFLTGECNSLTQQIFRMSFLQKLNLVTTARVVDELLFKIMLIEAREKFNLKSKIVEKLKKEKQKVKQLAESCRNVWKFLEKTKVRIIEVKTSTLRAIPDLMKEYGLFGNDALTLKTMKELNLKFILSSDKDFQKIDWIEVIDPKKGELDQGKA